MSKGSPAMSPAMEKSESDWRAEDDHRTLTRAQEIQEDTSRMKGVAKHHRKLKRGLSKVGSMLGRKR